MEIKDNYHKLKRYISEGGIFYALLRALKYVLFLIRRLSQPENKKNDNLIESGLLRVVMKNSGLQVFWSGQQLTVGVGLNLAMNILGIWTDSAKARWEVIDKKVDSLKIRVTFNDLLLSQIWSVKLTGNNSILWKIDLENKEWLHINELRFITLANSLYSTWFSGYEQGIFSRFDAHWHDFTPKQTTTALTGVRFPREETTLPSFGLETNNTDHRAIIQNTSQQMNAHLIGFRIEFSGSKGDFQPGDYHLADIRIKIFQKEADLDAKMESFRQDGIKSLETRIPTNAENKNFKVLLANLPWQRNDSWGVRAGSRWPHIKDPTENTYLPFPFFLSQAAALLKNNGINTDIIDALAEKISEENFIEMVLLKDPDYLVAETSVPSFTQDMEILRNLSASGIKIILCGPNAQIYQPDFMRQYPFVDFVLKGEYEFTLLELIKALETNTDVSKVSGLLYKCSNQMLSTPDKELCAIDSLPWPHRSSLPMDQYCDRPGGIPHPSAQMLASRGCPFNCSFCLWPQVMYRSNIYRARDINDVVNEMEYLVKQKGFKSIYFDDDTFNIGKERLLKFCYKLKERNLIHVPWAIMARADMMDEEILRALKESGLAAVKYGIESSLPEMIAGCQKELDLKKSEKMIQLTKSLGIKVHLTFIFGFPGETKETIQKTIAYGLSLDPDSVQFSILTPFPGTRLFEQLKQAGKLLTYDWSKYDGHSCCVFKTEGITPEELLEAKNQAYLIWGDYLRKKRGLTGDLRRFNDHLRKNGFWPTLAKTADYFMFIIRKRSTFANNLKFDPPVETGNNHKLMHILKNLKVFRKSSDTWKYIKNGNWISDYLDIVGIFNGKYAFRGPHHVQIDLTDHCNNNCLACWCNSPLLDEKMHPPGQKHALSLQLTKELLNDLALMGTKEIYFSGGGEPFCHPDIMDILAYAKSKGFICYLNTNFTLLDKQKIDALIDMKLDHLTVSTWSATAETYAATHPNKSTETFTQIVDNLKYLNRNKKRKPYVKLYNVIFSKNCHELKGMVDFARSTGSESLEYTLVDTIPGKTDNLLLDNTQIAQLQKDVSLLTRLKDKDGRINNVLLFGFDAFSRRVSSSKDMARATYDRNIIDKIPCYIGWRFARILPNGEINSCLKAHRIPMGNIKNNKFKDIWNGQKQVFFRKKTLTYIKNDPFFKSIGNNPDTQEAGCYKSCDDIGRNIYIHNRILSLTLPERLILKLISKTDPKLKPKRLNGI